MVGRLKRVSLIFNDKPRQCVESKDVSYSADKGPYRQAHGLPAGHIQL